MQWSVWILWKLSVKNLIVQVWFLSTIYVANTTLQKCNWRQYYKILIWYPWSLLSCWKSDNAREKYYVTCIQQWQLSVATTRNLLVMIFIFIDNQDNNIQEAFQTQWNFHYNFGVSKFLIFSIVLHLFSSFKQFHTYRQNNKLFQKNINS